MKISWPKSVNAGWIVLPLLMGIALQGVTRGDEENEKEEGVASPAGRHWIGILCQAAPSILRNQLKLGEQGLVVEEVYPDGPAAKAGIEPGDILLQIGDEKLTRVEQVVELVQHKPEDRLHIKLLRGGEEISIELSPERVKDRKGSDRSPSQLAKRKLGKARGFLKSLQDEDAEFHIRRLGPAILSEGLMALVPEGTSVKIERKNDQPPQITVERGDESWNFQAKDNAELKEELGQLPEELRQQIAPLIEQMVPGNLAGTIEDMKNDILMRFAIAPHAPAAPHPPGWHWEMFDGDGLPGGKMTKKLESIEESLDEVKEQCGSLEESIHQLQSSLEELRAKSERQD